MDVTFSTAQSDFKTQMHPKTKADYESNCTYCGLGFDCTSPRGMLFCKLLFICYFLIIVGGIILVVHIYLYPLHFLIGIVKSEVKITLSQDEQNNEGRDLAFNLENVGVAEEETTWDDISTDDLFDSQASDSYAVISQFDEENFVWSQEWITGAPIEHKPFGRRSSLDYEQDFEKNLMTMSPIEETESSTSDMALQELGEGLLIGLLKRK